jgi:ParB-like chromosome segregation protein Spo0J
MDNLKIGFELKTIRISLNKILPVRQVADPRKQVSRYRTIVASIKEVGLVEPLMVFPQKNAPGNYLLMDGHLRYHALLELGKTEADCIVASEDESFTYNARISRINPFQEHKMIMKAIQNGVTPERIAAALNKSVRDIRASMNLLTGIHAEAVEILKDKEICPGAIRIFKKVAPIRQIEMAELMVSANNYTKGYAAALLVGSPKDQLTDPEKPKVAKGLSGAEIARMEQEMESLQRDFKAFEENYGENTLNLTLACRYVGKLLQNAKVVRFLSSHYRDAFSEFEAVAAIESL